MAKTACEEAATFFRLSHDRRVISGATKHPSVKADADADLALSKRLRAEGRELKRLRTLIVTYSDKTTMNNFSKILREAARIQKARKAK